MASARALPRSLVLLLALAAGQAVAGTLYSQPLLNTVASSFAVGEGSAGALIAATQVGYAAGLVLLVPLGDVIDRRRLILLQLVLGALALAAAGAAGSAAMVLVAMAGVGLFAVVIQLLVVHAASLTPEPQRGEVVGAVTSGVVLGILQARTLAGPFAELGSWRTVYLTAAGLTLLVALVLLRRLPAGDHRRSGITYVAVLRSLPALYAGERPLRLRGALALLVFAALSVVWSSLVLSLTAPPHSLSHATMGLFGLTAIAGAIAARRAGRLADRGYGEHTTGLSLGLIVVAWLPLALIEYSLAAVAAGLVLIDLAVQAIHVTNQSMIYGARPAARSRLAGAYMVFYSIGIGGGSVASTATYAAGGWTAVCALGATISLAALALWTATTRRRAKSQRREPGGIRRRIAWRPSNECARDPIRDRLRRSSSARRQPRRTSRASGAEIMRTVANVGGSHSNSRARAWLGTATKQIMWIAVAVASIATSALPATAAADSSAEASRRDAADRYTVFRQYGTRGGLMDEFERLAAKNPQITKLVTIGETHRGQEIIALKVSRHARQTRDGRRPAALYVGAQHAREWISPEMVRRLARHVLDGYGSDRALTRLVDSTELWFVPVANPDGYDHSFTPGNRYWRKNLRDNNRDGRANVGDGVDLNRNFPTKWFYDDEGASSAPAGETFRGPRPASEPETRALDRLLRRVGFEFLLSYHSTGSQLLYGTAWQVDTPTPDDVVYEALAGDDADSAVPGYDPDRWADLGVGNGEISEHAHVAHGTLAYTPEMSSCATASASDPDDEWEPSECRSQFEFPDDEKLVAAEFAKNVPFALAVARSTHDPDHPVSVVGRTTPEFVVDAFKVSYGAPQTVAVTARRDQRHRRLNYRIDGGRIHRVPVTEWRGGERYGGERNVYYAEYRGKVRGARPGDRVEVWFTEADAESDHFTYKQVSTAGADALIVANEDYTGVNPTYPAGTAAPKYADEYAAALAAGGVSHATWDVDAQGVPHPLGVLSHFDVVVWESGDDRLPQEPEDLLTDTFLLGPLPDIAVAERQQFLTLAVRDYLNEGGKLIQAGETAQYQGLIGRSLGGLYYGLDGAPEEDCVVSGDFVADCGLLADDFAQYYLGVRERVTFARPTGVEGAGAFGGQAVLDNPLDEAGAFSLTSDALAPDRFPLFAGERAGGYIGAVGVNPLGPVEGRRYAGALHADSSYQRLARTIDLTDVSAADAPTLSMSLSFSTTVTFHSVILEAAPSGTDDWTTLPDTRGGTTKAPPSPCSEDLLTTHPFLLHYLTSSVPCGPRGTTGDWNAFSGESGGWRNVSFDLSRYAGRPVDVKVSYVANTVIGGKNGIGVFVDDTRVTTTDGVLDADGFERDTSSWTVEGPPPGSPPANDSTFAISTELINVAASATTEDTVLFGYGIEALATPEQRADVLGRALRRLLGAPRAAARPISPSDDGGPRDGR